MDLQPRELSEINQMTGRDRLVPVVEYLGTIGVITLVTVGMWFGRGELQLATIALLYLLSVFICSLFWGMRAAVVGSILAVFAFDFFFVQAALQFGISGPSDMLLLTSFLVVSIVASRLATRTMMQARTAELRAREIQILYDISQAVAGAGSSDKGLSAIAERTAAAFDVEHCAILLPDSHGVFKIHVQSPAAESPDLAADEERAASYAAFHNMIIPLRSSLYTPIQSGEQSLGVLRIGSRRDGRPLPHAEHRLLLTFAAAAGIAIDRRRLQESATEAEILRRSDELKSSLLSSVSHDLRSPLSTIKAGISALLEEGITWDRDAQRELLSAANNEVDRLTHLISNLLDLSRIEGGALRPDRQWYDIGELLREAVRQIQGRFPDYKVALTVAPDLEPVFVDYVQIQQVVANLVENASKYAPPRTTIRLSAAVEGDRIVMRVRDQGPGIPTDEVERIFSKFYQIGHHRGGTGLGLAICRGLVDAHDGQIWVENPGQPGAIFAVALPRLSPPVEVGSAV
jgi:two-component system, OmpR family, sensor histidine kinase KdpD